MLVPSSSGAGCAAAGWSSRERWATELAGEGCHRQVDACLDRLGIERVFPSGHEEPAPGFARGLIVRVADIGEELYEALSPDDRWPGAPGGAPLGRVGYWRGSAERHVF